MLLLFTDKYLKTHTSDLSKERLHYTITFFQFLVVPLFISQYITTSNPTIENSFLTYLKVVCYFSLFFALKYTLEKLMGYFLGMKSIISSYIFQKKTYSNYLSILFFPFFLGIIYFIKVNNYVFNIIILIYCCLLIFTTILAISNHRKIFYNKYYYFILYICTFEIAPYVISFLFLTKVI